MSVAEKKCSVEGCKHRSRIVRGFCITHYYRFRNSGGARVTGRHGLCDTPEYSCWRSMKSRCYRQADPTYVNYGARGIGVCDEWRNDFSAFLKDVGPRPTAEHSLDRINNDAGYSPENCRWATRTMQAINRRQPKHNTSGVTGVALVKDKRYRRRWRAHISVDGKLKYIGYFLTREDATLARKAAEERFYKPMLRAAATT